MNRTCCHFGSALLLLLVGAPVAAQATIEAGPVLGYYRPVGSFEPAPVHSTSLPGEPQDLSGPAWGGEARIWFGGRVGAQLRITSATSEHESVITPAGPTTPAEWRVTEGAAQVLIGVVSRPGAYRVWLSAGPGFVRHSGEAFEEAGSQLDVAGVVGVGGSIPLSSAISATAGFTASFYSYDVAMPSDLQENGESLQKGSQQDELFHIGLNWVWH